MKIARYERGGGMAEVGVVEDGPVLPFAHAVDVLDLLALDPEARQAVLLSGERVPLEGVRLLPPLAVGDVVAIAVEGIGTIANEVVAGVEPVPVPRARPRR